MEVLSRGEPPSFEEVAEQLMYPARYVTPLAEKGASPVYSGTFAQEVSQLNIVSVDACRSPRRLDIIWGISLA